MFGGFFVFRFFSTKKNPKNTRISCLFTDPTLGTRFLSCDQIKCRFIYLIIKVCCKEKGEGFLPGFSSSSRHGLLSTSGLESTFSKHFIYKGVLLPPPLQSTAQTVQPQAVHWAAPGYAPFVAPVDKLIKPWSVFPQALPKEARSCHQKRGRWWHSTNPGTRWWGGCWSTPRPS